MNKQPLNLTDEKRVETFEKRISDVTKSESKSASGNRRLYNNGKNKKADSKSPEPMIEEVGSLFGRIPFHKISSEKHVDVSSDEERHDVERRNVKSRNIVKTMSYDAVSLSDTGSRRRKESKMKIGGSTFLDIVSSKDGVDRYNEKRNTRGAAGLMSFGRKYRNVLEKDETSTSQESSFDLTFEDDKKKEKKPFIQMLN